MAEDIATLGLKIESGEVKKATKELGKLEKQSKETESATNGVTKSFGGLKTVIGAIAFGATARYVLNTADAFQTLDAQLVTATGSQEQASKTFSAIKDLASGMPDTIEAVTNSFIKLKNLGLTPSQEALKSYGNTAAAMGKDLDQLIEAVADAATGEFERLKEFGIKASNQGDKVAFTFQGTTTTVKNSARDIEKYLIGLGENQFAGAMEARNKTLGASFSNLADAIAVATAKFAGESGFNSLVTTAADNAGKLIRELAGEQTSSDIQKNIDNITSQIEALKESASIDQKDQSILSKIVFGDNETIAKTAQERIEQLITQLDEQKAILVKKQEEANSALNAAREEQDQQLTASQQQKLSQELQAIQDASGSKLDLLQREYEQRQNVIDMALLNEQISEEDHQALMTDIQKKYADARMAIDEQERQSRLSAMSTMFGNLASLMDSKNKEMFEIGKKAAIAQTIIETYAAAQKAYSSLAGIPVIGPALGAAAAAAAVIAGKVRVDNIQAQSFGGGSVNAGAGGGSGSNGTPGGGLPPMPIAPQGPQRQANIVLSGGLYNDEDIRNLVNRIQEVQQDMGGAASLSIA